MARNYLYFYRLSDEKWAELVVLLKSTGTYKRSRRKDGMEVHAVEMSRSSRNLEWLKAFLPWDWLSRCRMAWGEQIGGREHSLKWMIYHEFPHLKPKPLVAGVKVDWKAVLDRGLAKLRGEDVEGMPSGIEEITPPDNLGP